MKFLGVELSKISFTEFNKQRRKHLFPDSLSICEVDDVRRIEVLRVKDIVLFSGNRVGILLDDNRSEILNLPMRPDGKS